MPTPPEMSFLSRLREKKPDNEQGLKICYLLRINPDKTLALSFCLLEIKHQERIAPGEPYYILQQHLQNPPPFFSHSDVRLLQLLIDNGACSFQNQSAGIPADKNELLIPALLSTERSYIQTAQSGWRKLSLGQSVKVSFGWRLNQSGFYQPEWQLNSDCEKTNEKDSGSRLEHKGTTQLLNSPTELVNKANETINLPLVYHASSARLGLAEIKLNDIALNQLSSADKLLHYSEVSGFIKTSQFDWQLSGLPLPQTIEKEIVECHFFPVLFFSCHTLKKSSRDNRVRTTHQVELMFRYESEGYCEVVSYNDERAKFEYFSGNRCVQLLRNKKNEYELYQQLQKEFSNISFVHQNATWQSEQEGDWRQLLFEKHSLLSSLKIDRLVEKNFQYYYVKAERWLINLKSMSGVNSKRLELDMQLEVEGDNVNLVDLLRQLQNYNQRCLVNESSPHSGVFQLSDGRLLLLPIEKMNGLLEELGDLINKSKIDLPLTQVSRLSQIKNNLPEHANWQGDIGHLELANSLYQSPKILEQISQVVKAELRPYQWLGVCWLQHIKQHRVNGILADDMGLGKTLQTLTHLSLEKQNNQLLHPALIVAPTSLLHNWAAEIKKFTPHLKVKVIHGSKRQADWGLLNDYDLLISSYQLIVRDLEHWQIQSLSWLILDEAQQIKNPRTKIRQALKLIESEYRLCLSGTPVENHLGELWSLLDFLMADCLGTLNSFKQFYQRPIEKDADEARMAKLLNRIEPFIMRRTKDQVATDLPKKTEINQFISLTDEQLDFYQSQKNLGEEQLQSELEQTEHSGQKQMLVLTALLRLRQICCDPALIGETSIQSAKRIHCIEMIEELVAEKRAILVFSQFTSMLDLLAEDLEQQNINYLKLTGQTQHRQQLVDSFQQGEAPVFLISLKAGGVGLNLTRADTVIHYDPWWNKAAEQQATDRAHRIGQDKPVFVYKLIAQGTIEEKIAKLQQNKALLSAHINQRAQMGGEQFALKLEDLMALWQQEIKAE